MNGEDRRLGPPGGVGIVVWHRTWRTGASGMDWGSGDIPSLMTYLTSPLQDHPSSAEGHSTEPASGQGIQCDSPRQPVGQESPTLTVPSSVKVMPVPKRGNKPRGPLAVSKPEVPMFCTPSVWDIWGFGLNAGRQTLWSETAI